MHVHQLAVKLGCVWPRGQVCNHPHYPGMVLYQFSDRDHRKWVWVGWDNYRKTFVIHHGRRLP